MKLCLRFCRGSLRALSVSFQVEFSCAWKSSDFKTTSKHRNIMTKRSSIFGLVGLIDSDEFVGKYKNVRIVLN